MSCPFSEDQLVKLEEFVKLCKSQPQILHHPKLAFFKDYLLSLGVPLKTPTFETKNTNAAGDDPSTNTADQQMSSDDEEDVESDVELDMEGVIEADKVDDSQVLGGDPDREITDEERDQSDEKRSAAMKAFSEQNFEEAIKLYSEAIVLNPQSALLFAKRGQAYLKLNKPNACIKDCSKALELNCDSAAAYKFRGRAYRLLGKFEEASLDLGEALKIDYDDQTNEWLNEVKPNAEKLRQHRLSVQRKKEEREHREKIRRARKAQEARAKAARAQQAAGGGGSFPEAGGFPGFPGGRGFPGAGAGGGGQAGGMPDFLSSMFQDPDFLNAMQDPEVMNAFDDVTRNPANIIKYQNNPKVMAMMEKLKSKIGGFGFGAGGGAPEEPPSAPGFGFKPPSDDVGLD